MKLLGDNLETGTLLLFAYFALVDVLVGTLVWWLRLP
jgi:hypothetical protein